MTNDNLHEKLTQDAIESINPNVYKGPLPDLEAEAVDQLPNSDRDEAALGRVKHFLERHEREGATFEQAIQLAQLECLIDLCSRLDRWMHSQEPVRQNSPEDQQALADAMRQHFYDAEFGVPYESSAQTGDYPPTVDEPVVDRVPGEVRVDAANDFGESE